MIKATPIVLSLAGLAACPSADRTAKPTDVPPPIDDGDPPAIEGDHNLIRNGAFVDGTTAPWKASLLGGATGSSELSEGALCLQVNEPGFVAWDAQLRHRALPMREGHHYVVEFTASADRATQVRPKVGQIGPPYDEYWASVVDVGTEPQRYVGHFVLRSPDDPVAELSFAMGGPLAGQESAPVRVCIDDVEVSDPEYEPPPPPDHLRAPPLRVNQVGYLPGRTKVAVYRSTDASPVSWELVSPDGEVVSEGKTTVFGEDAPSGDTVHQIDFTSFDTPGEGYRLRIGADESDPFDIAAGLYHQLKYDAIAFFFHNRSGIEIAMPYAGQEQWAREAGHLSDGDVACRADLGCKRKFDVSGGWYDAGDHGKYVVNAGISVWTLLDFYERAQAKGKADAFADGKLAIPEQSNGMPDLLDEARWEIEFMLRMQIPDSHPTWGGLAFHKLHEEKWSPLPLAPGDAKEPRFLHRPSTAATLNLAAVAAQAARVYASVDPAFAKRCQSAAERAWTAAEKTPDLFAPGDDNVGGGPYEDSRLEDERYWAAIELYLTTGNAKYDKAARENLYGVIPGPRPEDGGQAAPMNWQRVEALGTISLAVAGDKRSAADAEAARKTIVEVARQHLATIGEQGYRLPLAPDSGGKYPWGSNSLVLNNAVLLGLAYDFTGDEAFLDGAVEAMDYLLGRNPLWQSYVTGYGENPVENPHHRFWAHQKDESYPPPPPGIVSGGPNSSIQDPEAQAAGLGGCPPQRCFLDHIESWSTNEIAINWNAPLFWVAAFLDEQAGG